MATKPNNPQSTVKDRVLQHLDLFMRTHRADEQITIRVIRRLIEALPAIQFERAASALIYEGNLHPPMPQKRATA
jgi:hypothetical protein